MATRRVDGVATATYRCWISMRSRCLSKSDPAYENYGGRGIGIDKSWNRFEQFVADMGEQPFGLTLERVNNEKGYSKENCRWATREEQNKNRRLPKKAVNNGSGLTGVCLRTRPLKWMAYGKVGKRQVVLYTGHDFFEACCARKSWENFTEHC